MLTIRRATVQDTDAMYQIQQSAFQEEGRRCGTMEIPPLLEPPESIAEHVRNQVALVALFDETTVGCVRGIVESGVCTIRALSVEPSRQGEGNGSKLLKALEAELSGVRRIDLTTNTLMEGNMTFYVRHGYEFTSYTEHRPGIVLVHMSKNLADADQHRA